MTIERNISFNDYDLVCDICGESAGRVFMAFTDAVNYKKPNGWKSQKRDGEWEDVCPECQDNGGCR